MFAWVWRVCRYDGANEVIVNRTGPTVVYATVVMTTVAFEDYSRIVWPASPAAGYALLEGTFLLLIRIAHCSF